MQSDDVDDEKIAAILDDLRQLRLRLAADLTVVGNAVASGDNDIAADIVDANSIELQHFLASADAYLNEAPADRAIALAPARARRARRRALALVPAVAVLAASATAAAMISTHSPRPTSTSRSVSTAPHLQSIDRHGRTDVVADDTVSDRLHQLRAAIASDRSPAQVLAAAQRLHKQLSILIAASKGNPAKVAQIERWLQAEQTLVKTAVPVVAQQILADSRMLVQHLLSSATPLPLADTTELPTVLPTVVASPSAKPSSSPHVTATTTPKASPSSSPSASSSSSTGGHGFKAPADPSWSPTNPVAGLGHSRH